jgi:phasin family protein
VADQLPAEVTESKAEVLPVAEAVKPAPAPARDEPVATAAKAAAPAPKPQPARRAAAKAGKKQPVRKAAAKTEDKKQPVRKAAAKKVTKAKPVKKPVVARKARPAAAPAPKTARAAVKAIRSIETGVKKMANTTSKTAETGQIAAEQFRAAFGDVSERAKAAAEKSAKIVEELADLTRGNVEAIVASSKIAAKGVESMSQDAAEYSRKSFEEASAVLKSFAEVKSATDFFKLQGDFARSAFDAAVAESARVSETVLKLAGDVAEPINSRYTVAAERVKTLAA